MQSISTVDVFISSTAKLFFSPKDFLLERYKMRNTVRKNLIIPTLCTLASFPVHATTKDIAAPTNNAANSSAIAAPAGNVTNPAAVAAPAGNVTNPAAVAAPAGNVTNPAAVAAPAGNVTNPAAVAAPAGNVANPSATTPVTDVAVTRPANEIGNLIASKQHPYLTRSDFTHRVADLDALYQASGYQPIWFSSDNSKNAAEVIKLLEEASSHGLDATDYETAMLRQKLSGLKPPLDMQNKDLAQYDTAISISLLRFMYDLHYGRINPRGLNFNIQQRTEKTVDIPELIKTGLAQNTLSQLAAQVEPKLPQYQKLKQALMDYRVTEKTPPLKLVTQSTIRPGALLPQSVELQQFLSALGDLPADKVDNSATTYTDTIVAAVKKYQQRHGLKASGLINKATVTAFATPPSSLQKVTQIELAMERLRWLPEITEGRAVMVNIPAFQLFAYDDINQDSPTTTMRVVVGKAAKNQTPLLTADMRFVDFHPYWNVPFKIARDEILPKLAYDPDYLVRQNMEFVPGSGSSALRLRQRPGKGNALGKVKFIFPNKSDVYLHDTPSVSLFGRARRDLSHGCVRVARPEELARFVLKTESDWNDDAIQKAIKSPRNRRVTLKDTIPVLFLYNTAFFNENNHLTFYADIYQHDAKLLTALKKPRKDLSDKELFAPKELPPADESNTNKIEAQHGDPVTTASAKQVTESLATVNNKQIAHVAKEVKPDSNPDTTLAP
jgi:murein L,D-transpeptidase YcbB/YkuD